MITIFRGCILNESSPRVALVSLDSFAHSLTVTGYSNSSSSNGKETVLCCTNAIGNDNASGGDGHAMKSMLCCGADLGFEFAVVRLYERSVRLVVYNLVWLCCDLLFLWLRFDPVMFCIVS